MAPRSHGQIRSALEHLRDAHDRPDGELLDRFARGGDQTAFAALVRRHGPMVHAACRRMLRDDHESEDAYQATFLILARRAASIDRRPLGPWLYGVAWRVAKNLRRQADNRPEPAGAVPDVPSEPTDDLANRECREIIDEEVRRLPEKYRSAVVLCYFQGQTYAQAAVTLGCPAGTVSARLARARGMLRDRLTRRGVGLSAGALAAALSGDSAATSVPFSAWPSAWDGAGGERFVALTEGVLRAMWWTKVKAALIAVAAVGLLGLGVAGLSGTTPALSADDDQGADDAGARLEREERELAELRQRLREQEGRVSQLREQAALERIAEGLEMLKRATDGQPERSTVVKDFEAAFGTLRYRLGTGASDPSPAADAGGGPSPQARYRAALEHYARAGEMMQEGNRLAKRMRTLPADQRAALERERRKYLGRHRELMELRLEALEDLERELLDMSPGLSAEQDALLRRGSMSAAETLWMLDRNKEALARYEVLADRYRGRPEELMALSMVWHLSTYYRDPPDLEKADAAVERMRASFERMGPESFDGRTPELTRQKWEDWFRDLERLRAGKEPD